MMRCGCGCGVMWMRGVWLGGLSFLLDEYYSTDLILYVQYVYGDGYQGEVISSDDAEAYGGAVQDT